MTIRYATVIERFASDIVEADTRGCSHRGRPVNCDCDTIDRELADQD